MDKLSQVLWRERELLEQLAYRLEVERLVLASGRTKWIISATNDIDRTVEQMREMEILRAISADEVAESLGLPPNPSLIALADASEEPWRGILLDHRDTLVAIAREIADLSESNKGLLTAGYRSAQETLLAFGGTTTETYTHDGVAVPEARRPRLIDRSL